MKNKTKTYILLAFVLSIWGIIGYKIVSAVNPKTPDIAKSDFSVSFTPNKTTVLDTFSIQTTKRDPFLGTLHTKKKAVTKKTIKENVIWTPILYHGCVINQSAKNKVFVISIDGEQFLMKLGQTINDITLTKGTTNNITVSYKGESKTVFKK